jgi:hypothetical protein
MVIAGKHILRPGKKKKKKKVTCVLISALRNSKNSHLILTSNIFISLENVRKVKLAKTHRTPSN